MRNKNLSDLQAKNTENFGQSNERTLTSTMSAIVTTKKEINEACLDFMLMEVVETVVRTSDPSAETVNFKLERMGFRVGQKLGER